MPREESYRITHWPEPMPAGPGLPVRKALAAMSVGRVTRRVLERETRLGRDEVQSLLDALDAQGVLARSRYSWWAEDVPSAAAPPTFPLLCTAMPMPRGTPPAP